MFEMDQTLDILDTIHSCMHASVLKSVKEFFQTNQVATSEVKQY